MIDRVRNRRYRRRGPRPLTRPVGDPAELAERKRAAEHEKWQSTVKRLLLFYLFHKTTGQ